MPKLRPTSYEFKWSHPLSWLFQHSHVPTKLFCACHKFVWRCALNSIESKCDISKFGVDIMTCEVMIQDLVCHVLVHDSFGCVFYGKNIAPPHQFICTIVWLKRWPNILVWLILHGLGHYGDHQDHRHNHTYKNILMVRIICVCEGHLKNKRKCMEHHNIPSIANVVFYWWGLYILLWGQVFVCIPL